MAAGILPDGRRFEVGAGSSATPSLAAVVWEAQGRAYLQQLEERASERAAGAAGAVLLSVAVCSTSDELLLCWQQLEERSRARAAGAGWDGSAGVFVFGASGKCAWLRLAAACAACATADPMSA